MQDFYPGGADSLSGLLMTDLPMTLPDSKAAQYQVAGGLSLDASLGGELCGPRKLSRLGATRQTVPQSVPFWGRMF